MKFGIFALSTVPGTLAERERLRPIGRNNERVQQMFEELRAIAIRADQSGFDAFATTEHHFHSEGLELSPSPFTLFSDLAARTNRIKLVTMAVALTSWDPLRLAEEITMLDHLSKGRFIPGIGRGYQHRWVNILGQQYGVSGARSDGADEDRRNREIFEELFAIMKAAWIEDAFDSNGRYYQVPHPYESGIAHWPAAESWTSKYGASGELDAHGRIRKISVVPKPYTLPHPPIWQPVTGSEETIRWCARQDIHPIFLIGPPDNLKASYAMYRDEMARHGRKRALGEGVVTLGGVNIGDTYEAAYRSEEGALGAAFVNYFAHFGYGKVSFSDMVSSGFLNVGTVSDVKRRLTTIQECGTEWFFWYIEQGVMGWDEVQRQMDLFEREILPEFQS
jgi:alkanesulfonate monooxygenase SsuD/methylene tetrahydromethanopterin reductase-like flavin-dependent oxidoreductase (luciferase family)